jgi:hypothetical protein
MRSYTPPENELITCPSDSTNSVLLPPGPPDSTSWTTDTKDVSPPSGWARMAVPERATHQTSLPLCALFDGQHPQIQIRLLPI